MRHISHVLNYGEKLDGKRWNDVKIVLNRNESLPYQFDENGVIVFCILKKEDPLYHDKSKRFNELSAMIADCKREGCAISPDFNPGLDLFIVNEASKLLDTYIKSKASLIIVGDDINEEYKKVLSQIKVYDTFVKMMVVKFSDRADKREILSQIKLNYEKMSWMK